MISSSGKPLRAGLDGEIGICQLAHVFESSSCCLPDGSDRGPVPDLTVRAPFSPALLGSSLFWSDLDTDGPHVCNKHTGRTTLQSTNSAGRSHWFFRLAALHSSLQHSSRMPG